MVNYGTGKVYRIASNQTDQVYIGSTCVPLSQRLAKHRSNMKSYSRGGGGTHFTTAFHIMQYADAFIVLIEDCPCESRDQLHRRERFHIENTPNCVNKVVPGQAATEAVECECGSVVHNMAVHRRTTKHESFMAAKQAAVDVIKA